ncbi:hypothetical protein Godav_016655 [Gossypium davidsonii]|uniref:Uncharacterized protein n=1 Tax=Gossypium davidsonii TaxID=34287 RepID=A0A7J8T9K7_GOSDV|nr:hypothetical protein [Gossypium davidsonii]
MPISTHNSSSTRKLEEKRKGLFSISVAVEKCFSKVLFKMLEEGRVSISDFLSVSDLLYFANLFDFVLSQYLNCFCPLLFSLFSNWTPGKQAAQSPGPTKVTKRPVPAHRRAKARGIILQDSENEKDS